jgi:hypothetical protein
MEEIYSKIQMTHEYLHILRAKLEEAEQKNGTAPVLATVALPFVVASCASARAAAVSVGVPSR